MIQCNNFMTSSSVWKKNLAAMYDKANADCLITAFSMCILWKLINLCAYCSMQFLLDPARVIYIHVCWECMPRAGSTCVYEYLYTLTGVLRPTFCRLQSNYINRTKHRTLHAESRAGAWRVRFGDYDDFFITIFNFSFSLSDLSWLQIHLFSICL